MPRENLKQRHAEAIALLAQALGRLEFLNDGTEELLGPDPVEEAIRYYLMPGLRPAQLCACGCGLEVTGTRRRLYADAACRKRAQRARGKR